jgi:tetratricopeptide (TPR) repeat protein
MNNNTGALAIFNKILQHHITVWALDNKGLILTRLGNYSGAISVLDTALKVNPDKKDAYTYYNLAMAWSMEGFHQHSVADLKIAIYNFNKELTIYHDQDAIKYRGLISHFLSNIGDKP